jgi:hypothetical protein
MKKEIRVFDKPKNVQRLLWGFFLSLLVLLAVEPFVHKHAEFPWEARYGFFATYGFVSCVALIYIAKGLRRLIRRDEDYYETSDKTS